ncbi:MAG: hypothetical protein EOM20_05260 [Spartobacteria bacterium]|nr:hypothetical protein [Spartobacteria bacterium]
MKSVCRCVVVCMMGACLSVAFAQEQDTFESNVPPEPVAWTYFTYEAPASFDNKPLTPRDADTPASSTDAGKGKVEIYEYEIAITPFIKQLDRWMFGVGTEFHWTRFNFQDIAYDTEDLYTIHVPFLGIYEDDTWLFMGSVGPGVYSDLRHLTDDDLRVTGYLLANYIWSEKLKLSLGAAYDRVFGKDQLYPLIGCVWDIDDEWQINLVLPYPSIMYAPNTRWNFFADLRPAGALWNVNGTEKDSDFKLEGYRFGLGAEYSVCRHVWLHLAGGLAFDRKYEYRELGYTHLDAEGDDTFFARFGLVFR